MSETLTLQDLAGSLHTGRQPSEIKDNEWTELVNFYQYGRSLITRPPSSKISSVPHSSALTGLFAYKRNLGAWTIICGTTTGLARVNQESGVIEPITIADIASYASNNNLWSNFQYNDILYSARKETGTLKRGKADFVMDAGIPKPATPPVVAEGAAGNLDAGTYFIVYTYWNPETGAEGNPSDPSDALVLGADKTVDYSSLVPSTNGQVGGKRLYRTLPNQIGEYYLTASVVGNAITTYSGENIPIGALGKAASFKNDVPPSRVNFAVLWKERAWVTDGRNMYASQPLFPEAYDYETDTYPVYPDDGHTIRGASPWGDRLFVGKTNAVHLITPSGAAFSLSTLSDRHGCFSHHSIKVFESLIAWYGGDDFYISTGSEPEKIGDSYIRTLLDDIPDEHKENICSAVVPALSWYVTSIPVGGSAHTHLLVYNYRSRVWTTFRYNISGTTTSAPAFLADFFNTNYGRLLYGAFSDGHVWDLMSDTPGDDGSPYDCSGVTKAFGLKDTGTLSGLKGVMLNCSKIPESLSIGIYRNTDTSTLFNQRTINLNAYGAWKPLALQSIRRPASHTQIRFDYSGLRQLILSELAFRVIPVGRTRRWR